MNDDLFQILGKEEGIGNLVDKFYRIMDTDPKAMAVRDLHPENLKTSNLKLFEFLVGRFGGPDLYIEKYGHPRMRKRHMPFKIGPKESEQWLYCMKGALNDMNLAPELNDSLYSFFKEFTELIKNSEE